MKRATWPDNTCSVGYTQFHVWLTLDEMLQIKQLAPSASFTPTTSIRKLDDIPAYIHVREDEAAPVMLMLSMECGRALVRGEGCWLFHGKVYYRR